MSYHEKWIRTCQECDNEQEDNPPKYGSELPKSYEFRKCKKCKSESLDYGSYRTYNEAGERIDEIE